MSSDLNSDDDLERTSELPVLSEDSVVMAMARDANFDDDPLTETGEHDTAALVVLHEHDEPDSGRAQDTESTGTDVHRLERDVAELSARWRDIESLLSELATRDTQTEELRRALAAAEERERQAAVSLSSAGRRLAELEQQLAGQIDARDAAVPAIGAEDQEGLAAELESLRDRVATLEREVELRDQRYARTEALLTERERRIVQLETDLRHRAEEIAAAGTLTPGGATELAAPGPRAAEFTPEPVVIGSDHGILICLTGETSERIELDKDETTFGRDVSCDVRIMTHFISRRHAAILRQGADFVIEDRDSTNGVFVNSVRVDRATLSDGDWITIGETQFRFGIETDPKT